MFLPPMSMWPMDRPRRFRSLKAIGVFWTLGGVLCGGLSMWIWTGSQAAWRAHLDAAYETGVVLYDALYRHTAAPNGVVISVPDGAASAQGNSAAMPEPAGFPASARITSVPLVAVPGRNGPGATRLQLHIVSRDLTYPVGRLPNRSATLPAEQLGAVTRLMASYCSDPVLFARFDRFDSFDRGEWLRVDAPGIWGCEAAPRDMRLLAVAVLVAGLVLILSRVVETTSKFARFARSLHRRGTIGGNPVFPEEGPTELRDIITTLNEYLAHEQDRLEKRALVLSGVSHDLGTPATRLRLRAALIGDRELREKLETDIDQMTGMIESVLTYTRSEMNAEETRHISLTALVESIVADYEDIGKPVEFCAGDAAGIDKSRSVFGGGGGNLTLPYEDARRVLVTARPVSLGRAVSNLIDNALKYGRRATVSVRADSRVASIIVEDEGSGITEATLNTLTGPFLRGENAGYVDGVGLGLTIVSTIARQHGGEIRFEQGARGLRAILTLRRQ
jgi:signal transduction histidine kinase